MSESSTSRAAELAAQQVESIVAAAQTAAESLKEEAKREAAHKRRDAEKDAETTRKEAKAEASKWLDIARREADEIGQQARRDATERVASAQEAAEDMLGNARAVSIGLRRLGESLTDQADTILREVTAAHKRMSADLRIVSGGPPGPPRAAEEPRPRRQRAGREDSESARDRERIDAILAAERGGDPPAGGSTPGDLDVPNWVEPDK